MAINASRWSSVFLSMGFLTFLATAGCSSEAPTPNLPSPAEPVAISQGTLGNSQDDSLLRGRLDAAIADVQSRQLQTTHAFWTIFHGILGLGPKTEIADPSSGTKVNALEYLLTGDTRFGAIRGHRFIPTPDGLDVQTGPPHIGQGHQDQFIAEVAQWGVPGDTPVVVYGKQYTLVDFVKESMAHSRVTQNQELSWAIVCIAQYFGTDVEWTNRHGELLKYEDIVRYELKANVENAACGGTHRLFGLTWALYHRIRDGGKVEGVWKEVEDHLEKYVAHAKRDQNPDGSFSANYFRGPGVSHDAEIRLASSGHILEWLATYLPDESLREEWMRDAGLAVSLMILDSREKPIESGALYHAIHGLKTYRYRMFADSEDVSTSPTKP